MIQEKVKILHNEALWRGIIAASSKEAGAGGGGSFGRLEAGHGWATYSSKSVLTTTATTSPLVSFHILPGRIAVASPR